MYTWRKSFASWRVNGTLYVSVPFTWLVNDAIKFIVNQKLPAVVGGPGAILLKNKFKGIAPVEQSTDIFEPLLFHNPMATFTTRGCVNKCSFCAVPKIEGSFKEIKDFTPRPVICDNNFLASSRKHFDRVIDKLKVLPFVDFNQGLEAKLFTDYVADRFCELKAVKVRFAFDSSNKEEHLADAISRAKSHGLKNIGVYMLYGFTDTPDDALQRAEFLRSIGVPEIFPMRYQPLTAQTKNAFVSKSKGWSEYELHRFRVYWIKARKGVMDKVPYKDFELPKQLRNRGKNMLFDVEQYRTWRKR